VRCTLRSSGLFHVEASWARISQFASRLAEARCQMVHMTSSQRLRRVQVEDELVGVTGCIGPCYH
jgi:hypothetical protein